MIAPASAGLERRAATLQTTQRIIWLGFAAAALLYLGVVAPFGGTRPVLPGAPDTDISSVLASLQAIAFGFGAAALAWFQRALSGTGVRRRFAAVRLDEEGAARLGLLDSRSLREDDSGEEALDETEMRELALLVGQTTAMIVYLALAEGVAVMGLVAAILARDPISYLPYGAATILLCLPAWPDYRRTLASLGAGGPSA